MEISQDLYSRSWRAGYDAADRYTNAEAAYVATQLTTMVEQNGLLDTIDRDAFMDGWIARKEAAMYYNDDPELDRLIAEDRALHEIKEANSEISRHHKDFQSISALCTLWRNGIMDAEQVLRSIQNIVG